MRRASVVQMPARGACVTSSKSDRTAGIVTVVVGAGPLRPTVRTRAPTSVLGRSVWKKARDARQDAASPWPKGGA